MEKETKGFRQLTVWQMAYELTLEIYRLTKRFPKTETYGLISP
ncbi:MAG: four helix bundle protein [Nitrospirota bacterium]